MSSSCKKLMSNILSCKFLWAALAALAVYSLMFAILPRQPWLEAVRITQATTAMTALVALSYEFFRSISRDHPDRVDAITVSSWLKDFAFFWMGIWMLLFRLSADNPDERAYWMIDTAFFCFVSGWIPALASAMVALIPGVFRHDPETGVDAQPVRLVLAGVIAGAGLFGVLVVLAVRPNTHTLVEMLRPWTP